MTFRPVMLIVSTFALSKSAIEMISWLLKIVALAPSESGAETTGVPAQVTVLPAAESVIVTVMVPVVCSALIEFSVKRNVAVPAEVAPCATLPALVCVMLASAAGAAAVMRSEARSAALVPTLTAFFQILK